MQRRRRQWHAVFMEEKVEATGGCGAVGGSEADFFFFLYSWFLVFLCSWYLLVHLGELKSFFLDWRDVIFSVGKCTN